MDENHPVVSCFHVPPNYLDVYHSYHPVGVLRALYVVLFGLIIPVVIFYVGLLGSSKLTKKICC